MKQLTKYGVASGDYKTAIEAASHTYMDKNEKLVPTPLIFADNPFNEQVKNAKNILDLGCGVGRNLSWIMENTNAHYWGFDPNQSMLDHFWEVNDPKWKDRVTLAKSTDEINFMMIDAPPKMDVVVCTFVYQHIGYRPDANSMNITDITQEVRRFSKSNSIWIMYEHDWEEIWIDRWFMECGIDPDVYKRDYTGIEELTHRRPHHLIIFEDDPAWEEIKKRREKDIGIQQSDIESFALDF